MPITNNTNRPASSIPLSDLKGKEIPQDEKKVVSTPSHDITLNTDYMMRDGSKLNMPDFKLKLRSIEDPELVKELVARQITLEVCPGSNVVLGLFPDFASHPIQKLRDAGVKVTVSTDDPPFFHTTMRREYEMLQDAFEWADCNIPLLDFPNADLIITYY